ncbi:hypothetical protein ACHAXS_006702, partial [Conticribra weissflogii]
RWAFPPLEDEAFPPLEDEAFPPLEDEPFPALEDEPFPDLGIRLPPPPLSAAGIVMIVGSVSVIGRRGAVSVIGSVTLVGHVVSAVTSSRVSAGVVIVRSVSIIGPTTITILGLVSRLGNKEVMTPSLRRFSAAAAAAMVCFGRFASALHHLTRLAAS